MLAARRLSFPPLRFRSNAGSPASPRPSAACHRTWSSARGRPSRPPTRLVRYSPLSPLVEAENRHEFLVGAALAGGLRPRQDDREAEDSPEAVQKALEAAICLRHACPHTRPQAELAHSKGQLMHWALRPTRAGRLSSSSPTTRASPSGRSTRASLTCVPACPTEPLVPMSLKALLKRAAAPAGDNRRLRTNRLGRRRPLRLDGRLQPCIHSSRGVLPAYRGGAEGSRGDWVPSGGRVHGCRCASLGAMKLY